MVVHFNRLKKCPANLRDGLQPLQYNSPGESGDVGQLEGTKSVGTQPAAMSTLNDLICFFCSYGISKK